MCGTIVLIFLFYLTACINANGQDEPSLGISFDSPRARRGNHLSRYSSKLTFHNFNDPWKELFEEDERTLSQVVKDAFWQMNRAWLADNLAVKSRPFVMTGLLVGSEMYLSSSIKGGAFLYFFKDTSNPVYDELMKCQREIENINGFTRPRGAEGNNWPAHKNNAGCGEPMVLYMYFQDHPDRNKGTLAGSRIVTVLNEFHGDQELEGTESYADRMLPYESIRRFDPCGTPEGDISYGTPKYFGCYAFAGKFGLIRVLARFKRNAKDFDPSQEFDDSFNLPKDGRMTTSTIQITCHWNPQQQQK